MSIHVLLRINWNNLTVFFSRGRRCTVCSTLVHDMLNIITKPTAGHWHCNVVIKHVRMSPDKNEVPASVILKNDLCLKHLTVCADSNAGCCWWTFYSINAPKH